MTTPVEYLFVYGTLRPGTGHPMSVFLEKNAHCIGRAKTPGRLYDLGNFPGMLEAETSDDWVHGDLLQMSDPATVLRELDRYEECSPDDPEPHYFGRRKFPVFLKTGEQFDAWAYYYLRAVDEKQRIKSGEYQANNLHDFDWTKTQR